MAETGAASTSDAMKVVLTGQLKPSQGSAADVDREIFYQSALSE